MNNDTKISVNLIINGGTRHLVGTKEIPFVLTKKDLTPIKLTKKERDKVVKKGVQKVKDYVWEDASIHINMTRMAYNYFISTTIPEGYNEKTQGKKWKNLTPEERLEWHISSYASARGAKSYNYTVLED